MAYERYRSLAIERRGKVLVISFNRPQALNTITAELHRELSEIFADVEQTMNWTMEFPGGAVCEATTSYSQSANRFRAIEATPISRDRMISFRVATRCPAPSRTM